MASNSYKTALYFLSVLLTVGSQFFADAAEQSNGDQQHLYPCWTFANCLSAGPESEQVQECFNLLEPEDLESSMKTVKSRFYSYENDDAEEALREYCNFESEQRKDAFERTSKGLISHYMTVCSSPTKQDECTRWGVVLDCVLPLLDELDSQKKCVIDQ